jgi:septum formation protein
MKKLGLEFTHTPPKVEEDEALSDPVERVERNSLLKAKSVQKSDSLVIGSDTIVYHNGEIMGKPSNENDAKRMLWSLSEDSNKVYSGVSIVDSCSGRTLTRHAVTEVWFKKLSQNMIDEYVDSGEPMDKAGAYGIQGFGGEFIDRIEGSYSNVVGLPLELLTEMLQEFSVQTK